MLEKNQRYKNRMNALSDGILLCLTYWAAYLLRFTALPYFRAGGGGAALEYAHSTANLFSCLGLAAAAVTALWLTGVYSVSRLRRLWKRCATIAAVQCGTVLGYIALMSLHHWEDYSRLALGLYLLGGMGVLTVKRLLMRAYNRARRRRGLGLHHVLLLGGGKTAALYLRALEHNPYYGFAVDGYLAECEEIGFPVPYLGGYENLETAMDAPELEELVIALEADETELLPRIFAACNKHDTRITMVPFYSDYLPAHPTVDVIDDCKLINVRQTPFDNILNAVVKRGMDIVGSLLLIVLTSPVMLATAIGVRLSGPGPIIFKQERVGLNKRTFMMYKFRSMRVNADSETGWSTDNDSRRTKFGSFIRKFSLDEFPQFFNVLKGEMSLVGPRPEVPFHVEHFKNEIPRYLVRQQVRPGCTGWAQINGLRGDTDITERIRYDIWYIENWSVALDIKILFCTVFGGKMVNDEKMT